MEGQRFMINQLFYAMGFFFFFFFFFSLFFFSIDFLRLQCLAIINTLCFVHGWHSFLTFLPFWFVFFFFFVTELFLVGLRRQWFKSQDYGRKIRTEGKSV